MKYIRLYLQNRMTSACLALTQNFTHLRQRPPLSYQPLLAWVVPLPSNSTSPLQANEDVLQHMKNLYLIEDQGPLIRLCESLHGKVQSSKRNFSFSSFNAA